MMAKITAWVLAKSENYVFWSMPESLQFHKNYLRLWRMHSLEL